MAGDFSNLWNNESFAPLKGYLEQEMLDSQTPGLCIWVVTPEGMTLGGALGVADVATKKRLNPHALMQVGSQAKFLAALALMKLAEDRKVDLKAPLTTILPAFQHHELRPYFERIKIWHLLEHRAPLQWKDGLQDDWDQENGLPYPTPRQLADPNYLAECLNVPLLKKSDELSYKSQRYSNAGFAMLSAIIPAVTGQPYGEIVQQILSERAAKLGYQWDRIFPAPTDAELMALNDEIAPTYRLEDRKLARNQLRGLDGCAPSGGSWVDLQQYTEINQAFFTNKLLKPGSVEAMMPVVGGFHWGRGTFWGRGHTKDRILIGNSGVFKAHSWTVHDKDITVTVATNYLANLSDKAINRSDAMLVRMLERVIDDVDVFRSTHHPEPGRRGGKYHNPDRLMTPCV
jgi:CubicO group peptidase (beta-lactamase class C family)